MENQAFAHRYREVAVRTANPMQLVVILYDAAICSIQEAREHIESKNIESRSRSINKCISIISELQSSLNLKSGGDIALSLDRLYDYMKRRIFEANAQQSAQMLEEIEPILENLRSAWRELTDHGREEAPQSGLPDIPGNGMIGAPSAAAGIQVKSFNVSI